MQLPLQKDQNICLQGLNIVDSVVWQQNWTLSCGLVLPRRIMGYRRQDHTPVSAVETLLGVTLRDLSVAQFGSQLRWLVERDLRGWKRVERR